MVFFISQDNGSAMVRGLVFVFGRSFRFRGRRRLFTATGQERRRQRQDYQGNVFHLAGHFSSSSGNWGQVLGNVGAIGFKGGDNTGKGSQGNERGGGPEHYRIELEGVEHDAGLNAPYAGDAGDDDDVKNKAGSHAQSRNGCGLEQNRAEDGQAAGAKGAQDGDLATALVHGVVNSSKD